MITDGSAPFLSGLARDRRAEMPLLDPILEFTEEFDHVGIEKAAHVAQFDRIDAPHTSLDIADEGLAAAELVGQRFLSDARVRACLADEIPQQFVFGAMDRLGHGRNVRWRPQKLYVKLRYLKT